MSPVAATLISEFDEGMAVMAEDDKAGAPAGWYSDADGVRAYFDGAKWLTPAPDPEVVEPPDAEPGMTSEPEPTVEWAAAPAPHRSRKRLWIVGGSVLGLLIAGGVTAAALTVNAGAPKRDAEAACRAEIVSILKSPTTATLTEVETVNRSDYVTGVVLNMYDALGQDPTTSDAVESLAGLADKAHIVMDQEAEKGQVTWFVVGNVDSENGFGAMVRNTWHCETLFEGGVMTERPDASFDGED